MTTASYRFIRMSAFILAVLSLTATPVQAWLSVGFADKDGKPITIMRKFEIRYDKSELQWLESQYPEHLKQIGSGEADKTAHFADSPYLQVFWTLTARNSQRVEEAIQLLEKAMKVWPKDDEPYWLMARIYLKHKPDKARAGEWFARAVAMYEQNAERYRNADVYWYALAHRHYCCRDAEKATECFLQAVESGEEKRRMMRTTVQLYRSRQMDAFGVMKRGSAYYDAYDINQVHWFVKTPAYFMEKALEVWPEDHLVNNAVAQFNQFLLRDFQKAIIHYEKAFAAACQTAISYTYEGNPPTPKPIYAGRMSIRALAADAADVAFCYLDEIQQRELPNRAENVEKAYQALDRAIKMAARESAERGGPGEAIVHYWENLSHPDHNTRLLSVLPWSAVYLAESLILSDYPDYPRHAPAKGLEYALKAYQAIESQAQDKPERNQASGAVGIAYYRLGRFDEALPYLQKHKANYMISADSMPSRVLTLDYMARIHEAKGNPALAVQTLDQAMQEMRNWRKQSKSDEAKLSGPGRLWRDVLDHRISLALQMNKPDVAFESMEFGRGAAMLDLLHSAANAARRSPDISEAERKTLLAKADELRAQIEAEKARAEDGSLAPLQRSLVLVQEKAQRLKENTDSWKMEIKSGQTASTLSQAEARKLAADSQATIIEYWGSNCVAVIGPGGISVRLLDRPWSPGKIADFRDALLTQSATSRGLELQKDPRGPSAPDKTLALAQELYDILIRPLETNITTEVVYVAPDRDLNFLPFQALHDGKKFLAEKWTLAYAPSASVLKLCMDRRKKAGGKILAMGNPNLQEARYKLANAEQEVRAIARLFPESKVLIGDDASEKAVHLLGREFDVLHFACHGTVDLNDPMRSCLRLAPDKDNDGYLHAGELFNMAINAGLVTMSACETGLGKVTFGSEVLGLTRAFMFAGTPSVAASLWKVDDRATAELMVEFYRNLKTQNKAEALRNAQVKMIKDGRTPFQWAAFCLYGDYR